MPPSTIAPSSIPKLLCLEILRGCGILTEEHPRCRLFDSFRGAHLIVGDVLGGMKAPIFRLWKLPMRNSQGGFLIPPSGSSTISFRWYAGFCERSHWHHSVTLRPSSLPYIRLLIFRILGNVLISLFRFAYLACVSSTAYRLTPSLYYRG